MTSGHAHHHSHAAPDGSGAEDDPQAPTDASYWDARYAAADQLWSGEPNSVLVDAAAGLAPGRAVDVGCGEGADAVWLASRGWDVTALDVSRVALERAEHHAREAGVSVRWVHAGLVEAQLPARAFELVSAQYPVLARTPHAVAEHTLIDAVAPGGTLAVAHHADFQADDPEHHGFNPADYVGPWNIAPLLGNDWQIDVNEIRPRTLTAGAGARHTEDVLLIARRLR
jgi:SAM-dependent methyltransferase